MNHENIEGVEPIPRKLFKIYTQTHTNMFNAESGLINDHINTTFTFKPKKTYRLRLINMSGIATFKVFIDDHDMEIIEVDGVSTLMHYLIRLANMY